jgi:hypothetical protein
LGHGYPHILYKIDTTFSASSKLQFHFCYVQTKRKFNIVLSDNNSNRMIGVLGVGFPAGAGNFSLDYRVQNGSGAHPASYPMDTKGSFRGGKVAGA